MSNYQTLTRWITFANDAQTIDMGVVPGGSLILLPYLIVKTAFNSNGTDLIRIGTVADDDAFGTDKDVSSAFATPANFAAGVSLGYYAAGIKVQAKYVKGGTAPTTGEALLVLPYLRVPTL